MLAARAGHWEVFRGLLPLVWPASRPDLRVRVVLAFGVLLVAKLVTVAVPVFYKNATDMLTAAAGKGCARAGQGVASGIGMLILAYGIGRVLMMALTQVRDVIFTEVGQNAVRQLNNRTFEHLHRLSLRFHLERRTGGLSRVIERATRGIELIIRMGILNVVPTALELLLVCGMLLYYFDWRYVAIMLATVVVYMWFTFSASRAAHRHPSRDERQRHRGQHQGDRQPVEFRDGQVLRQRGAGGAPLRYLHGALRAGGDQDVPFARHAQHRPGADLHGRHDRVHAAGCARHHRRRVTRSASS